MTTEPMTKNAEPATADTPQMLCINPATGQPIREVPLTSLTQVSEMAKVARAAFPSWQSLSIQRRGELLLKARDILIDRRDEVVDAMMEETGKPRMDASADLLNLSETISYYVTHAPDLLADRAVTARLLRNKRLKVQYMPRGLVVNISPWNYPLDLAWSPLIPALLAGNVVINKPSEVTPLTSLKFHEILMEAGIPEAVAQIAIGHGDVGQALIEEADYVAFTGSVDTGRKVAVACAERLIPCTLELGGKDPAIVLADADVERTANGIVFGAFFNSGQTCISIERVYAVEDIYEPLVEAIIRQTQQLRQGIDENFNVDVGSMIDPRQIETIEAHVADAVEKGATVHTGGQRNPHFTEGHFYEPTVLTDVTHDMLIMTEETFGPVLPIMKVRDAEEALTHANSLPYGLNSSVWTKDMDRARAIARRLEAGSVCVNECMTSYLVVEAPFGGVKNSGIGRRKGPEELRKYCHEKTVMEDIFQLKREPIWFPYSPQIGQNINRGLGLLYRSGISHKIKALFG